MKRIELYREFQKNITTAVQNEALMCGMKEYSISIKKLSTEVSVFVHGLSAVLIFYIGGRVDLKNTVLQKQYDDTILLDKIDWDYVSGRCTVADLMSRYVFEVFNVAIGLRQEWRRAYRERYTARLAAVAAAVNTVREGEANGI